MLSYAVQTNNNLATDFMIKIGVNVNTKVGGETMLKIARQKKNMAIVELLLNHGAS